MTVLRAHVRRVVEDANHPTQSSPDDTDLFGTYLVNIDIKSYASAFEKDTSKGIEFTLSLMIVDMKHRKFGIALISVNQSEITYIALIRRIQGSTSVGSKFTFIMSTRIEPINIKKLVSITSINLTERIVQISTVRGKRFNYREWQKIKDAMVKLRPASATAINALDEKCIALQSSNHENSLDIMLMERDTLGLALQLSSFDRSALLTRLIPYKQDRAQPALSFLKDVNIIEDDLIVRDMKVFPDWFRIDFPDTPRNIVQFEKDNWALPDLPG